MMINISTAAVDAEAAILGAMLIDDRCIGDVMLAVSESDFLTPRHGAIFTAIRDLFTAGRPADPVTVLGRVGTECRETLRECMDTTPTAANVLEYCRVLREQSNLYRLREAAEAVAEAESLDEARDILTAALSAVGNRPGVHVATLSDLLGDFFRRMSAEKPPYIRWGIPMLDGALSVAGGKYILLGARPSTGKTALALQLAMTVAEQKRVTFFSLETDDATAADRIVAQNLGTSLPDIQRRRLGAEVIQSVSQKAASLAGKATGFEFITGAAVTVADIRSIALARHAEVVVIDYVQLIKSANPKLDRTQAMQEVSMELRAMAQLTGITVVALAQLRRPDPGTRPKAPTMADLKESGQFEQDADAVLLLYHVSEEARKGDRYLKIDKNKEGEAGIRCRLSFDGRKQRFTYIGPDRERLIVDFAETKAGGKPPFKEGTR